MNSTSIKNGVLGGLAGGAVFGMMMAMMGMLPMIGAIADAAQPDGTSGIRRLARLGIRQAPGQRRRAGALPLTTFSTDAPADGSCGAAGSEQAMPLGGYPGAFLRMTSTYAVRVSPSTWTQNA